MSKIYNNSYQKFLLCLVFCSIVLTLSLWLICWKFIDSSSSQQQFISWININTLFMQLQQHPNFTSPVVTTTTTSDMIPKYTNNTKLILHIETNEFHYARNKSVRYRDVRNCPPSATSCTVTNDLTQFSHADAIIFNGRFMTKEQVMSKKPKDQVWIYYQSEAPIHMGKDEVQLLQSLPPNTFNWTATYRTDSDIYMPYRRIVFDQRSSNSNNASSGVIVDEYDKILEKLRKKKMVCWIVSNCHSTNKRELLAATLSKYITVDIYGACGTKNCTKSRSNSTGRDCRKELASEYKFYLAFENSLCQDYITEKFFDIILGTDMVPIVYGLNYSSIPGLPSNSYINVHDFSSVEELANYLIWLDGNPKEYMKYLEAKHFPTSISNKNRTPPIGECELCDKLWNGYTNSYEDIYFWWTHSKSSSNYTMRYMDKKVEANDAPPPLACYSENDWPIMSSIAMQ